MIAPEQNSGLRQGESLTRSAFWLMLAKTLGFGFSFLIPVLLVRLMSQVEFGIYKQAFLLVGTAVTVFPLGFAMSAFYFLPRETRRKQQVALNILVFYVTIGGTLGLLLAFWPASLSALFRAPELAEIAPLIGGVIFLWVVSSCFEMIAIANEETELAATFIGIAHLVRALLLLAAALLFASLRALLYAALIQGFLQTGALLLYLRWRFNRFWRGFDPSLMRSQLSYAMPLGLAGLLYSLHMDLHHYVVSHRFGPAVYAIYAIGCFQLPLFSILRESVSSVVIARVSFLQRKKERRAIVALLAQMIRRLGAVFLPAYALLLVSGREVIAILFTEQYLESWPIFAIHLTLLPMSLLASASDAVLRAYPEHRYFLLRLRVVLFGAFVFALWHASERFYLIGAVSAVAGIYTFEQLIVAWRVGRILGVSRSDLPLLKDTGKIAFSALLAGAVTALVRELFSPAEPLVVLLACGLVFSAVHTLLVLHLGALTPLERETLRRPILFLRRLRSWLRTAHSPE